MLIMMHLNRRHQPTHVTSESTKNTPLLRYVENCRHSFLGGRALKKTRLLARKDETDFTGKVEHGVEIPVRPTHRTDSDPMRVSVEHKASFSREPATMSTTHETAHHDHANPHVYH